MKYFFLKSSIERNAQGEMRTVLHFLPGQENRLGYRTCPLRTDLKVQTSNEGMRLARSRAVFSIFAVKIESHIRNLFFEYSRNGVKFYRAEDIVAYSDWDEETTNAYNEYLSRTSREETSTTEEHPVQTEESPSAEETAEETPHIVPAEEADFTPNTGWLTSGERFLRLTEGLPDSHGTITPAVLLELSQLTDRLNTGICIFRYIKTDGDERNALGTRNAELISHLADEYGAPVAASRRERTTQEDGLHFHYFDLEKMAWRCFLTTQFVCLDDGYIRNRRQVLERIRNLHPAQ